MHTMLLTAALSAHALTGPALPPPTDLLTIAESSGFTKTATHAEVLALLGQLAVQGDHIQLAEIGRTVEDRAIPVAIVANPPVHDAAEARAAGKPIFFVFGDIHAGEVCGKEAMLMLLREFALDPEHPLLEHLVFAIAPIYNGDGNDRMGPDNRPGQHGPDEMGQRPNARGLDLNREWMKLESPEAQAMVRFLTSWDPDVVMDLHTTNGSYHQYVLTWAPPLNPSADPELVSFVRDDLLETVTKRLAARTGYETFPYGNFNRAMDTWSTYSSQPRYGGPYRGLRGHLPILSEAYAYASYRDRVLATLEFVREVARFAGAHGDAVLALRERVRQRTVAAGAHPQPDDLVGLRHRLAPAPEPAVVKGYVMEAGGRRPQPTEEPHDYTVRLLDRFEPTLSVARPHAYVIPPGFEPVVMKLQQHGIRVGTVDAPMTVRGVRYTVTGIQRARRAYQGHQHVLLDVEANVAALDVAPGSTLVTLDQPLGTLAVVLLEPQSDDGLVAWNFLDDAIAEGAPYPIVRIESPFDLSQP